MGRALPEVTIEVPTRHIHTIDLQDLPTHGEVLVLIVPFSKHASTVTRTT